MLIKSKVPFGWRGMIQWSLGDWQSRGHRTDCDGYLGAGIGAIPSRYWELVHTFEHDRSSFKSIPLKPDAAFQRQLMVTSWAGFVLWISGFALLLIPLLIAARHFEQKPIFWHILALFACTLVFICLFWFQWKHRHQGQRDQKIRLVLGCHEWGSSDPATWHAALLQQIMPVQDSFGTSSYAQFARDALKRKQWSLAMWAARFSCAIEDATIGEELTDEVLQDLDVIASLDRISTFKATLPARNEEFGPPISLSRWVRGDLAAAISKWEDRGNVWRKMSWANDASQNSDHADIKKSSSQP